MAITKIQDGGTLVTGDIFRAAFYTWYENQVGIMDIAYVWTNAFGSVTFGDAAFDLQTALDGDLQAILGNTVKILGCRVTKLNGIKPFPLAGVATSTSTGSMANKPLPTQVRGLIATKGPFASRIGRGRIFPPFAGTDGMDTDSTPTAAHVTNLQTFANDAYAAQAITGTGSAGR